MSKKKTDGKKADDQMHTLKGMRDLIGAEYYAYQGFFEKAAEIAIYYGFRAIETPIVEYESLFYHSIGADTDIMEKEIYTLRTRGGDKLALRPEGTAPVMRAYFEHGMQSEPQPVLLYYGGQFFRHDNPQRGRYRELRQFGLEAIGTGKSITDAMIIKVILTILEEAGLSNLKVEINSIGDKDCRPNFKKELTNYYKKHIRSLCPDCRDRLKTNPMRLLDCKNAKCQELKADAPSAVGYLCGSCKQHFKEVLEYLDTMNVAYELNNSLVRGLDYYSRTVFEISTLNASPVPEAEAFVDEAIVAQAPEEMLDEDGEVVVPQAKQEVKKVEPLPAGLSLAGGGRYDYLAKALGNKKGVSAVGAAIGVDRVIAAGGNKLLPRIIKKPKIFFIQLSFEAKLKSMVVIEVLRKAKIPIAQAMTKDSLGAQLAIAERLRVPYCIILGQKEALEGSVIFRDMNNRSQHTIKIDKLAEFIKTIK